MPILAFLIKYRRFAIPAAAGALLLVAGVFIWFKATSVCRAKFKAQTQERTIGDYEKLNKVRSAPRDVRITADRLRDGTF
jgi:hypothetical protein